MLNALKKFHQWVKATFKKSDLYALIFLLVDVVIFGLLDISNHLLLPKSVASVACALLSIIFLASLLYLLWMFIYLNIWLDLKKQNEKLKATFKKSRWFALVYVLVSAIAILVVVFPTRLIYHLIFPKSSTKIFVIVVVVIFIVSVLEVLVALVQEILSQRKKDKMMEEPVKKDGFTLLELLIVISIIAMIAAIVLPSLLKSKHSVAPEKYPGLFDNGKNVGRVDNTDKDESIALIQRWIDDHPNKIVTCWSDNGTGRYGRQTSWFFIYYDKKELVDLSNYAQRRELR